MFLQQPPPFIVEVVEQPPVARDISIDVVLGMFQLAGAFLIAAALGSAIVAAVIVLVKRWRGASASSTRPGDDLRLRIY